MATDRSGGFADPEIATVITVLPALALAVYRIGLLHELAKATGKQLLFDCAFGERSAKAVQAAQDAGMSRALHIAGGIAAWKKAGGAIC